LLFCYALNEVREIVTSYHAVRLLAGTLARAPRWSTITAGQGPLYRSGRDHKIPRPIEAVAAISLLKSGSGSGRARGPVSPANSQQMLGGHDRRA